jgi:hypothetical protein
MGALNLPASGGRWLSRAPAGFEMGRRTALALCAARRRAPSWVYPRRQNTIRRAL